jgi:hypothetical protein
MKLGQKELEDVGLSRARRRVDDDIPTLAQGADGLLLPEIGDEQGLEEGGDGKRGEG